MSASGLTELMVTVWIVILIVASTAHPVTTSRKDSLFYIYDYGSWKDISNISLTQRDPREIMDHYKNHGAGPMVNISEGSYHTDQYQLFNVIYNRAKKDPRRTYDPSKATTFFVPYDLASDCAFYKSCARTSGVCYDFRKCPLAPTVDTLLRESPWWKRHKGKDHILIVGMNYAMNHYIGKPKCKQLLIGACMNCTKWAIDDYAYLHSDERGVVEKGDSWHAAPFPADFHWSKYVNPPFPWENLNRPILCSYVGSTQSYYRPAARLRQAIAGFCLKHPLDCVHQTYGLNGTRFSFKVDGWNPLKISQHSVFCFQPIGDLMTRKGLFDSILQGCIPVTFDSLTARVMYTWHWEEEFWNEVSVELPFTPVVHRSLDVVVALKQLMKNNASLIAHKQALIRSRVFELQYGVDGRFEGLEHSLLSDTTPTLTTDSSSSIRTITSTNNEIKTTKKLAKNWPLYPDGTPMRDAYDIIMDHTLGFHSGLEADIRNGSVPECWNGYLDMKARNGQGQCLPGNEPKAGKQRS